MKFKTFRNIAITVGVVVGIGAVGGGGLCAKKMSDESKQREQDKIAAEEKAAEAKRLADEAAAAAAKAEAERLDKLQADRQRAQHDNPAQFFAAAAGLKPSDADVLAALQRPTTDKIKDATAGKAWKVNVYADDKVRFNRAKVDMDRDGKWDESWTVKADGTIEKKVAPADDEKYTSTFRLDRDTGWVSLDAKPAAPATVPATTATTTAATASGGALSASDQKMLELIKSLPPQEKIKDAAKGQSFKINLYSDDGAHWSRAKVDLDRDEKWDESWTFKDGAVVKKVAPNDDESYGKSVTLVGNAWK